MENIEDKAEKNIPPVQFAPPDGHAVPASPELDAFVLKIIGLVADKWTMIVLEVLAEHEILRFSRIAELVGNISQKMLTKTLREMERDGFVIRTVHPVIPPHVDYQLTPLERSLGEAFCSVWIWAEKHYGEIEQARKTFQKIPPSK